MKEIKITSEDLINKEDTVRCTAEEMTEWFATEEDVMDSDYHKCSVCGYYFSVYDGAGECEEVHVLDNICNDCIDLLKQGIKETDIPYYDFEYRDCIEDSE